MKMLSLYSLPANTTRTWGQTQVHFRKNRDAFQEAKMILNGIITVEGLRAFYITQRDLSGVTSDSFLALVTDGNVFSRLKSLGYFNFDGEIGTLSPKDKCRIAVWLRFILQAYATVINLEETEREARKSNYL